MQTREFLGHVQHRAALPDLDSAIRAARATRETLAERIGSNEARDPGAQLPSEIAEWLKAAPKAERFSSDEFLQRVNPRQAADLPAWAHGAPAVLEVPQEAAPASELPGRARAAAARLPAPVRGQPRQDGTRMASPPETRLRVRHRKDDTDATMGRIRESIHGQV